MIVTKKYITKLREKSFIKISEATEKIILEKLGKNPSQMKTVAVIHIRNKTFGSK